MDPLSFAYVFIFLYLLYSSYNWPISMKMPLQSCLYLIISHIFERCQPRLHPITIIFTCFIAPYKCLFCGWILEMLLETSIEQNRVSNIYKETYQKLHNDDLTHFFTHFL